MDSRPKNRSMPPLIFLDFDGVLNSHMWFASKRALLFSDRERERVGFDPKAIEHLNLIVAESGASVVISSNWRKNRSIKELQTLLENNGFRGRVVGKTAHLLSRGEEVSSWIRMVGFSGRYVVLDDNQVTLVWDHFVKVDPRVGLQRKQVEQALKMLSKKNDD